MFDLRRAGFPEAGRWSPKKVFAYAELLHERRRLETLELASAMRAAQHADKKDWQELVSQLGGQ